MKQRDVVICAFPGAESAKARPAIVLSTDEYHRNRPDVILGVVTTQKPHSLTPTDCPLVEWRDAGLHAPSYFRLYVVTVPQRSVRVVDRLADGDWAAVQERVHRGLGLA